MAKVHKILFSNLGNGREDKNGRKKTTFDFKIEKPHFKRKAHVSIHRCPESPHVENR